MVPVAVLASGEVDVHELRVRRDLAEVVLLLVMVLDEVVPEVPLPDDLGLGLPLWLHLDDRVRPDALLSKGRGVAPRLNSLLIGLVLPRDHEHVAVR